MSRFLIVISVVVSVFMAMCFLPVFTSAAWSFGGSGCGTGECRDCHSLTKDEVKKLLPPGADSIDSVKFSDIGGLWEVQGEARGQKFTLFIDFSKKYLIAGSVLRLQDGADLSRIIDVNELKSNGSFLIGDQHAPVQVYVFTDVHCGHCRKLHQELLKVVEQNKQIAFRIKLLAMFTDKKTVNDIVCSGSLEVLDGAMHDKPVPENKCTTLAVEETLAFAKRWNIRSTPTMVLPDGRVLNGGRSAETLIKELQPFLPAH